MTQDGPCFDEDGVLKNGHHRLLAVIKAGVPAKLYCTFNIPRETTEYDTGRMRDLPTYLRFNVGLEPSLSTQKVSSIAKLHMFFVYGDNKKVGKDEIVEFIRDNQEGILLARSIQETKGLGKKKKIISTAPFGYAILSGYNCGVSEKDLRRFGTAVATGLMYGPDESAALVIRNMITDGTIANISSGNYSRAKATMNIQRGMADYLARRPRKRNYNENTAIYTDSWLMRLSLEGVATNE